MLLKGKIKTAKKGKTGGLLLKIQESGVVGFSMKVRIKGRSISGIVKDKEKIQKLVGRKIKVYVH